MSENVTPAPAAPANPTPEAKVPEQTTGTNVPTHKPQPAKEAAPAQAPSETFEVKVNGQVRRVGRDEAIRLIQLGYSANERFEQGAALSKKGQAIIESAKANPIKALMEAGLNKDQIRAAMEAWYTQEFIEPETLPKEELRARRAEAELEGYKKKEAEAAERARQGEEEKLTAHQRSAMQQQIIDAMEAHKLPKNKFTVARIAFYMRQSNLKGYDAPMDLIVQKVKEERQAHVADIAENASYEQLIELFGESTIKKIREEDLKNLRANRQKSGAQSFSSSPTQEPRQKTDRVSMRDVDLKLRAMRLGK